MCSLLMILLLQMRLRLEAISLCNMVTLIPVRYIPMTNTHLRQRSVPRLPKGTHICRRCARLLYVAPVGHACPLQLIL
jgi:hypothetical protein